jgi:hypothetical protein
MICDPSQPEAGFASSSCSSERVGLFEPAVSRAGRPVTQTSYVDQLRRSLAPVLKIPTVSSVCTALLAAAHAGGGAAETTGVVQRRRIMRSGCVVLGRPFLPMRLGDGVRHGWRSLHIEFTRTLHSFPAGRHGEDHGRRWRRWYLV